MRHNPPSEPLGQGADLVKKESIVVGVKLGDEGRLERRVLQLHGLSHLRHATGPRCTTEGVQNRI